MNDRMRAYSYARYSSTGQRNSSSLKRQIEVTQVFCKKKGYGFQAEDFAQLHPGGSLGRQLLTRITDIMRQGDQLARVKPADTIATALDAMKQCKAGAVVATNEQGQLQGIFTHGDFVRAYQEDRDVADHLIRDHMTANPVTIQGDKLAAEAVHTFEQHLIDEVVVINAENQVIGLIDVQDLSRARIF